MTVVPINPANGLPLSKDGDFLVDRNGEKFPIIGGVPRISEVANYARSFGLQWNRFPNTQFDRQASGIRLSESRFFAETRWDVSSLRGKEVLEVGSGAGRFSRVVLEQTEALLTSVDYSDAVSANFAHNGNIAPARFRLFQASIYELPFPDNSFDAVFCLGVLQHTPDFAASVEALVRKVRPGGEIVVDFYPVNGWWTKINAKYLLRPFTKKMTHERLLHLIEANIDWLIRAQLLLHRLGLGALSRFLPVCNVKGAFPVALTQSEVREWAILDTLDQYSPEHDHPQRISYVTKLFEAQGARVTFAGIERFEGSHAAVVRAVKAYGPLSQ